MNAYQICCSNGEDTTIVFVNEETWNWFQVRMVQDETDDATPPPEDQVQFAMAANSCGREEAIEFLSGDPASRTFDNDIALMLTDDSFSGEKLPDGTIVGVVEFLNKHGLTLASEYHGAIY